MHTETDQVREWSDRPGTHGDPIGFVVRAVQGFTSLKIGPGQSRTSSNAVANNCSATPVVVDDAGSQCPM